MSNYEALRTATANPSEVHDFLNDQGTIQKGKRANIILTKTNPLENLNTLKEIQMVFVKGRKIESEILNELVLKANDRSNLLITALRYGENLVIEK